MIKEAISKVVARENLSSNEAEATMEEIMTGKATPAQISAFLVALRMKGESIEEITSFVKVMREKATLVKCDDLAAVDTCGTGGDKAGTFNISTVSAFIAAASGVKIAKHGNRAVSSACGSADVLKALGANLELTPEEIGECIKKVGIGFLFAPLLHKAMKYALPPRREIGIRTVFNILGPLTNPARVKRQVLGVFTPELTQKLAGVLKSLGHEHSLVIHSEDGLDEISLSARTKIVEQRKDTLKEYYLAPEEFGFERSSLEKIKGGSTEENVQIFKEVLEGKSGPCLDISLLNAGGVIYVSGQVSSIKEGVGWAREAVLSGKAKQKLDEFIEFTKNPF